MKKYLMDVKGYEASNPFIIKEPFKHIFMRWAFLAYQKFRISISRWVPLSDWQINMWIMHENKSFGHQNAASYIKNIDEPNTEQPFFWIENIIIMELIPKEQMDSVIMGIRKFRNKHGKNSIYDLHGGDASYFKGFNDGEAYTSLGSLSIKDESKLKKYINQISFQTINLSDSFCCLNILVHINKQLKDDLSNYMISNVPEQHGVSGFEYRRWYQITNLGRETFSGSIHKYQTVDMIIIDIKWNVMKEILKFIKPLIFQSQSINSPGVCSTLTNIDGIQNQEFWSSLDVDSRFCDFYNNDTACIAWRNHSSTPFFIYSKDDKNEYLSHHIGDELCSYLIASKVDQSIRDKLTKFSLDLSKLKKKSARHWLKSKVKADLDMFYEARFLSEYNFTVKDEDFSEFTSLNNPPIILLYYKSIKSRLHKTKKLFEDVNNLYKSNIDYKNAESLYRMQGLSIMVSIISALVAVAAIFISISSDDIKGTQINSFLNQIKHFFRGF